ncbi:helix-turn-helix transcriptional regulator [Amycolatopsis anabasis]|uniref:helix-turn-helix transcriptional regulator n=1 Tax=Amycolatopsis anabasis TaxID=1840409 RepID=UPI00131A6CE6|nr:LuxR C-terminal-related transcriptional regulator [Amycolatopsis anabasis]
MLDLALQGINRPEIARRLLLSLTTVTTRLHEVSFRIGANDNTGLVVWAYETGYRTATHAERKITHDLTNRARLAHLIAIERAKSHDLRRRYEQLTGQPATTEATRSDPHLPDLFSSQSEPRPNATSLGLSQRQRHVLDSVLLGNSNLEIGRELGGASVEAAKSRLQVIYGKTDTHNRTELAVWAYESGYCTAALTDHELTSSLPSSVELYHLLAAERAKLQELRRRYGQLARSSTEQLTTVCDSRGGGLREQPRLRETGSSALISTRAGGNNR